MDTNIADKVINLLQKIDNVKEVLLKDDGYVRRIKDYKLTQSMKHAWRGKRVNYQFGANKYSRKGRAYDIKKDLTNHIKDKITKDNIYLTQ